MAEAEQLYTVTEGWISALYLLMLSAKESRSFADTNNIHNLVKTAIYDPFSEEIKDFLLHLCIFDSFTMKQAVYLWGSERAELLLGECQRKKRFCQFRTPIQKLIRFTAFSQAFFGRSLIRRIRIITGRSMKKPGTGVWKPASISQRCTIITRQAILRICFTLWSLTRQAALAASGEALIIHYFEQCPSEYKKRHPVALLVYAMALMTFNETELFQKTCSELSLLIREGGLDAERVEALTGELELLLSFTCYNDIVGMSEPPQESMRTFERTFCIYALNWQLDLRRTLGTVYVLQRERKARTRDPEHERSHAVLLPADERTWNRRGASDGGRVALQQG